MFSIFRYLTLPILIGAVSFWAGVAQAGDPGAGQKTAERWCASCHTVSSDSIARDVAPPFKALARNSIYDRDRLLQVLSDPHPPMPRIHLSRTELDNIIAYIGSLRPGD